MRQEAEGSPAPVFGNVPRAVGQTPERDDLASRKAYRPVIVVWPFAEVGHTIRRWRVRLEVGHSR